MAKNWNQNDNRNSDISNQRTKRRPIDLSSRSSYENYSRDQYNWDDDDYYSRPYGYDNDSLEPEDYQRYADDNRIYDRDRSLNRDYSTYGGSGYNNRSRRPDYGQPMEMNYGRNSSSQSEPFTRGQFNRRSNEEGGNRWQSYNRDYAESNGSRYGVTSNPSPSTFGPTNQDRSERNYRGVGPKSYKKSDERIKDDICELLMDHNDIDAEDIEIEVKNGEVTLSGTVSDKWMKYHAEDIIENLSFVNSINNDLKVNKNLRNTQFATDDDSIGFKNAEKTKKSSSDRKNISQH